ncbi:hypothetical protein SLS62_002932 [Diatrype stigma]|uniref:Major facilitator superfamily (MFS) profile domain-containing protein n=1 Tax=Diatrype stigma TaxID=117547 RepID=A0AAN9YUI7_9PEZI
MTSNGSTPEANGSQRKPADATENDDEHHTASETTPLLKTPAAGPVAPIPTAITATSADADAAKGEDKPLPKLQIALLCYARLVEPIAFFSIFPYINQMVQRNGELADTDVGFYSGLIESLFSLTQMSVMLFWGWAGNRVGRKPVLVGSLAGVSVAIALFGLARSIGQMVLFRCTAGVFSGTIVTIRTMVGEHSTPRTQARSFSWFAFAGNLGIFLGPLIGGALADPAGQYPNSVFGGVRFFEEFPYALPSIVVGCIGLTAVATSALFVEETLPAELRLKNRKTKRSHQNSDTNDNDNENGDEDEDEEVDSKPKPHTLRELLQAPGVGIVLYNYLHVMFLAVAYTAVVPVFWFTPPDLGGLGFSPLQISLFMGLTGLSQAIWLLVVFPPLQRRLGTNGVMRACGTAYPFFMAVMPGFNAILRAHTDASRAAFWTLMPVCLALGPGVSMAFTGAQLALNDASPSAESLSMLNALALTGTSALRSFSPALFASLFAVGARSQILRGYLVWVVLTVLSAGFTVSTRYLPPQSEKKAAEEGGERGN